MATTGFDQAVTLQLDIFRASAGIARDVVNVLRDMERELVGRLATGNVTEWGRARATKQLAEVRETIKAYYAQAADTALQSTTVIAEVAALATAKTLAVGGAEVLLPTLAMMQTIASQSVIQGAAQGAWWAKQAADTQFRFARAVRQGLAGAETNQQIINRVKGFLDTSRSNAAALVQTSVATVANDAREFTFERNSDIIKRYRAVATLDSNTCARCAPLDGLEWTPEGKPIGHGYPRPHYPLHFNCRCLVIPRVFDSPPGGMRASADGPVPAKLTFSGWLERQPKEVIEETLGKGRAELFSAGKITLRDLTSGNGRPLTLDQLRQRHG